MIKHIIPNNITLIADVVVRIGIFGVGTEYKSELINWLKLIHKEFWYCLNNIFLLESRSLARHMTFHLKAGSDQYVLFYYGVVCMHVLIS